MKKIFAILLTYLVLISPVLAKVDKSSEDYLKNKKHFSFANNFAETVAEKVLKKAIKNGADLDFDVKLKAYTLSSMRQGIFKYAEFTGNDLVIEEIPISKLNIKTVTDYNWIDYRQNPVKCKTDTVFEYEMYLTQDAINKALEHKEYYKNIQKVNQKSYPFFTVQDVRIDVNDNKVKILVDYMLPLSNTPKVKTFAVTTDFIVDNNVISAYNIAYNKAYGNLGNSKVINLINLLDPLSFTLSLLNPNKCNARIENVKIVDNYIVISGKIYLKAEM